MAHKGFRLHPEKDADILADLAKYKDTTSRLKEIYRKGLQFERGIINTANWWKDSPNKPEGVFELGTLPVDVRFMGQQKSVSPEDLFKSDQLTIKVNNKNVEPKEAVKANILQGFD